MLKKTAAVLLALSSLAALPAEARDRYRSGAPVMVDPALTAPWVMQLGQGGAVVYSSRKVVYRPMVFQNGQQRSVVVYRQKQPLFGMPAAAMRPQAINPAAPAAEPVAFVPSRDPARRPIDPAYLPQTVAYDTEQKPGTIVIDTNERFLYLVLGNGEARRYGVGVGKPGFEWRGTHRITRKQEWPTWNPPAEMRAREAAKGHILPASMEGGVENPLGARAMYLGSTLYRIHGTNAPWTIGYAVSSGCIRMRNEDVVDLYERVKVGTKVIVL
ncbi:L,D-transpeptidase [Gellertiella hungarica]|uniref:Lipoprotein-anchoring transpeptidase ErfK/SrfK n=1 Tax=Gellertiella hungarica TaxID=1572859 RepID=A0A7W6NK82_9HYPH|nr:L,D-transpeptidase [Gellertiella hungarica]MBB4064284.1 lipoprotein-anchoring transpeptidase ErfK/SrfK [Gellertiella hungarica]